MGSSGERRSRKTYTEDEIRHWLVTSVASVVKMKPEHIDATQSFDSFGMDSLQAVSLSGDLEEWIGEKLSPTLAWDYPSIDLLVRYLVDRRNGYSPDKPTGIDSQDVVS